MLILILVLDSMNLANKVKSSLIAFLVLSIFILIFFIFPLNKDIKNNAVELASQKQDSLYLDNRLKSIEEFRKDYKEIRKNIDKGQNLFVKSEAPVNFIGFLEEISENSNVSIKISPFPVAKKLGDKWHSMVFQISAVADFENFLKFLEKIESGPYLIQIENLDIVRLTAQDLNARELAAYSVGDIKTNFSLKTFANQISEL